MKKLKVRHKHLHNPIFQKLSLINIDIEFYKEFPIHLLLINDFPELLKKTHSLMANGKYLYKLDLLYNVI